jgi:integrase
MPRNNKLARLPKLYNYNCDLSKNWYIDFGYRNPVTLKMDRFRRSGNINNFSTAEERTTEAKKLIAEYTFKIKAGFNPYEDDKFVYDALAYEAASIKNRKADYTIESYLNEAYKAIEPVLRKKSKSKYLGQIRTFCYWLSANDLDNFPIDCFDKTYVEKFLATIKFPTTRNGYKANLGRFWNELILQKVIKENPWKLIKKVPEIRKGKLPFSKYQINLLKDKFTKQAPDLWLFCCFQHYCFIRPGELRLMKISYIDFEQQTITVPAEISKNKKRQTVWIPDVFVSIIQHYKLDVTNPEFYIFGKENKPGKLPFGRDYYSKLHKKFLIELNISNEFSLYSWKHTGAKSLATKTGNVKELQMQLRHHDLNTTDIYLKSLGIMEFSGIKTSFPAL